MEFTTHVDWIRWLFATGIVACLLFALYLFTLKFGHQVKRRDGLPSSIEILERYRLGPKHTVIYGKIDGETVALLLGPNGDMHLQLGKTPNR